MYDSPWYVFGIRCPDDALFRMCPDASVPFFGCVAGTTNPCTRENDGHLPNQEDLRPMSFDTKALDKIPDEECDERGGGGGQSDWWRCVNEDDESANFMGCCESSPCGGGCLPEELIPAKLSSDPEKRHSFLSPLVPYEPKTSSSTSAAPTREVTVSTPATPTPTPTDQENQISGGGVGGGGGGGANGVPGPTIAGIVLAVVCAVAMLAALIVYLISRKRKRADTENRSEQFWDPLGVFPHPDGTSGLSHYEGDHRSTLTSQARTSYGGFVGKQLRVVNASMRSEAPSQAAQRAAQRYSAISTGPATDANGSPVLGPRQTFIFEGGDCHGEYVPLSLVGEAEVSPTTRQFPHQPDQGPHTYSNNHHEPPASPSSAGYSVGLSGEDYTPSRSDPYGTTLHPVAEEPPAPPSRALVPVPPLADEGQDTNNPNSH